MKNNHELKIISQKEETKIKKTSTIIMIIIIIFGSLTVLDAFLTTKGVGPFLALKVKTYNDGGTKEYLGFGYKVIKYNQTVGRKDTVIGNYSLKYNTTPKDYTVESLAYDLINNPQNYVDTFIRLTGTITNINKKAKTVTMTYRDSESGKYDLKINIEVISDNINTLTPNTPVSLIGVIKDYKSKTVTIKNAFIS